MCHVVFTLQTQPTWLGHASRTEDFTLKMETTEALEAVVLFYQTTRRH